MPEQHTLLGGKVDVYKRPNSSPWQCSTYRAGKNQQERRTPIESQGEQMPGSGNVKTSYPLCLKKSAKELLSKRTRRVSWSNAPVKWPVS